nr:uncharacterized protein LOC109155647 [Ipomoea batatas]
MRALKTAKCLPEEEWKICGNCTTINGIAETAMILAAYPVHTSVLTPDPTKKIGPNLFKNEHSIRKSAEKRWVETTVDTRTQNLKQQLTAGGREGCRKEHQVSVHCNQENVSESSFATGQKSSTLAFPPSFLAPSVGTTFDKPDCQDSRAPTMYPYLDFFNEPDAQEMEFMEDPEAEERDLRTHLNARAGLERAHPVEPPPQEPVNVIHEIPTYPQGAGQMPYQYPLNPIGIPDLNYQWWQHTPQYYPLPPYQF